jgi:hypothetical protein
MPFMPVQILRFTGNERRNAAFMYRRTTKKEKPLGE